MVKKVFLRLQNIKKAFTFCKKTSLSCCKKYPLNPPETIRSVPNFKKIKSREHSSIPILPGTATAF